MVEIRFIESGELADYRHAIDFGFGQDPSSDDRALQLFEAITTPETSIVAVDRGKIVATFGSYDLDMTMPGGAVAAMAGTTHVTVHPTHRRQGLLTKMMRLHIDQAIERGQPMAGLWSSEERIYGRFGYGPAIWGHDLKIPARTVDLGPPVPGISVHPLTAEEAQAVLPPVYGRQLPTAAASAGQVDAVVGRQAVLQPAGRRTGDQAAIRGRGAGRRAGRLRDLPAGHPGRLGRRHHPDHRTDRRR